MPVIGPTSVGGSRFATHGDRYHQYLRIRRLCDAAFGLSNRTQIVGPGRSAARALPSGSYYFLFLVGGVVLGDSRVILSPFRFALAVKSTLATVYGDTPK